MTRYEDDIMEILHGDTPRQKHDFLIEIMRMFKEKDSGVEVELLNVCSSLEKKGEELYSTMGNASYELRCFNHDARMLIYGLTNKCRIEKMTYIKWREEIQTKIGVGAVAPPCP